MGAIRTAVVAVILSGAALAQTVIVPSQSSPAVSTSWLYYNKMRWAGAWSGSATYSSQEVVTYAGYTYVSSAVLNFNHAPAPGGTAYWAQLPTMSSVWGSIGGTMAAQTDLAAALAAREPSITAGTTAQFWRGDKSWRTLDTAAVPENGNLYFTPAHAIAAVSGTSPISLNSGTGAFSCPTCLVSTSSYVDPPWLTFTLAGGRISGWPTPTAQGQHLRIAFNKGNDTTLEYASPTVLNPDDYNFPAQSPAGELIEGNTTITLAPVPQGVNWNDPADSHLLWVAGTGTPEACHILTAGPGTAIGHATTGTLTITCAKEHSAGWTIQSVAGGGPEATQHAVDLGLSGAIIEIATPIRALAKWTISDGNFVLRGSNQNANATRYASIWRASGFTTDHMISVMGTAWVTFEDMEVAARDSTAHYASIYCGSGSAKIETNRVIVTTGWKGIISDGCGGTILDQTFYYNDNSAGDKAAAGFTSTCTTGQSAFFMSNSGCEANGNPELPVCVQLDCVDGLRLDNVHAGAQIGLLFDPSGHQYIANAEINGFVWDAVNASSLIGIEFAGTPTLSGSYYRNINVHGGWINCEGISGARGIDVGQYYPGTNLYRLNVSGVNIQDCGVGASAIDVGRIVSPGGLYSFTGNQVSSGSAGGSGFLLNNNVSTDTLTLAGNTITGFSAGLNLASAVTDLQAGGNNLTGNTYPIVAPVSITGTIANNAGIDSVVGAATLNGSTLTVPFNPIWVLPAGSNSITGILIYQPSGSRGHFRVPTVAEGGVADAFTAGATIGNTGVALAGKVYEWYMEGALFWISGSGF
jgi:hypothetical protein